MSPITRKVISGFITLGTVVAMGALSFVGATHFTSLLPICALAFLLTGTVDAQMFWQNFSEALKSLFDSTDLERTRIRQRLKKLLEEKADQTAEQQKAIDNNLFLQDYITTGQELAKLKHEQQHQHDDKDITDQAKAELKNKIEKFIARQRWMEEFILKRLRANKPAAKTTMEHAADAVLNIKTPKSTTTYFGDFDKETSRKKLLIRIGFGACLIIGAFNFFAMIGTWELGVASFATFAVIPGGVVIPLMLLGAIGFALLMYQGILDVVKNGLLDKWKQQIQTVAEHSDNKWKMGAIYFAAFITVGLGIFAMVCTAGTWFSVMGSDAQMLASFTMGIANIIGWIGAVVLALPLMLFNTVNNLEAFTRFLKQASSGITIIFSKLWKDIKEAWYAENFIQFINPFRLIAKIITSTLFLLHMAADGMQADAFPERYAAAIDIGFSNGMSEFASVYEEQLGEDAEKNSSKNGHEHGPSCSHNHHHEEAHPVESTALLSATPSPTSAASFAVKPSKKVKSYEFLEADNKHDHHSHVFFDLVIFLGPFLPGLIWDLVLGTIWYYTLGALGRVLSPLAKPLPPPSFAAVKERFFSKHEHGHHHDDAEAEKVAYKCSDAWLVQEVIERVEEDQNSYLYISEKISEKNQLKQQLVEQLRDAKLSTPQPTAPKDASADVKADGVEGAKSQSLAATIALFKDSNSAILAKNRNSQSKGTTHSVEFLNELANDPEYSRVQLAAAAA